MNKIQVAVLAEGHQSPGGMMMFLARLTQRGHDIKSMDDLLAMYNKAVEIDPSVEDDEAIAKREKLLQTVSSLPHGTITRFSPITIAIVGASRRFLAQARTHQVGMTYVSASLQYSDYSGEADYVVPYPIIEHDAITTGAVFGTCSLTDEYLKSCRASMETYKFLASETDNDTAGYAAPQGLRNILIMQGNNESWAHFIRMRACNRNTLETQFVALKIWEELLHTVDGEELFSSVGPDCVTGTCREGKFSCGKPLKKCVDEHKTTCVSIPRLIIDDRWPLLKEV